MRPILGVDVPLFVHRPDDFGNRRVLPEDYLSVLPSTPRAKLVTVRRVPLVSALAVAGALLAAPAPASATRHLWATVNVCDTAAHPNMMGVRGRMPGDGTRAQMYMRFKAQYLSGRTWVDVGGRGTSPWLAAGSARFVFREIGYTFEFRPPAAGVDYLLRGRVTFEWRERRRVRGKRRWVVVKRRREVTEEGHRSTEADPEGYTAATCRVATGQPAP